MASNAWNGDIGIGTPNPISFLSWNIKGLNNPVKRSRVFSHLKKLKADVVFLQETHLLNKDHSRLHNSWFSQVFHSLIPKQSCKFG